MARYQKTTFIALHGFLGDEKSFSSLKELGLNLKAMDLRPSANHFASWEELLEVTQSKINEVIAGADQFELIGYSMGGRVLLELLPDLNLQKCQSINLLSSHVGQYLSEEKEERFKFSQKCLSVLETKGLNEFYQFWNTLPLFSMDSKTENSVWTVEEIRHFLKFWSDPKDLMLDFTKDEQSKIKYAYGEHDLKYADQAKRLAQKLPHVNLMELAGRSHRLLNIEDMRKVLGL